MLDLRQRSLEPELMDGDDICFEEFHHCLQSLETINHLTLAYRPTLNWLGEALRGGEACILDAGCGGGDMLRRIEGRARRRNWTVSLIGVDRNPWSKRSASLASPDTSIRYETQDIFHFDPRRQVDIIVCSLFTHHLDDEQLLRFLRWIDARARRGWFINDLHRHPIPYYFIKAATRVFSRNRLIRHDAAVSVARAFSAADWRDSLQRAGLRGPVRVQRFFPFRLCVSCLKA